MPLEPVLDDGDAVVFHGDCVEALRGVAAGSVDAVVTAPPRPFPGWQAVLRVLKPGGHVVAVCGARYARLAAALEDAGFELRDALAWVHDGARGGVWPAHAAVALARRPLTGTVVANVLKRGTGALNVNGCRIPTDEVWVAREMPDAVDGVTWGGALNQRSSGSHKDGRWPANVVLDAAASQALDEQSGETTSIPGFRGALGGDTSGATSFQRGSDSAAYSDTGGASRFFFRAEEPVALLRWLVRLVTPPGGVVLDPFAREGEVLLAARLEGFRSIGVEADERCVRAISERLAQQTIFRGSEE